MRASYRILRALTNDVRQTGHADCVAFVKSFNLPLIVLGGGGYTIRNVARAWAFETGVLVGEEMSENLPFNDYMEYYGPEFKLSVPMNNMGNYNTREYLDKTTFVSRTLFLWIRADFLRLR